jgi:DNA polymerase III sliding clamp (beta) subunit (PCNA family)
MYFRIEYNNLRKLTKFVGKVSTNGSDLMSTSVILSTTPTGIHMQSLAPGIWAEGEVEADVEIHGQVALNGNWFSKVIAAMNAESREILEVAETDGELDVQSTSGHTHRQFPLVVIDSLFPHQPVQGDGLVLSPDTCDWIKLAQFAASSDNGRPSLNGVHLHPGGIAATDSYKFVLIDFDWAKIKPTTVGLDMIKMFPDSDAYGDGEITVVTSDYAVNFRFGDMSLIGAKIGAEFPKVEMIRGILPEQDTPYQFEVEVKELKQILGSLSPFGAATTGATLHPDGFIRLVTQDQGMAENKVQSGKVNLSVPVTLNIEFLRQVERLVRDDDTCTFMFNEEAPDRKPYVILKDRVTVGCMPMKTQ